MMLEKQPHAFKIILVVALLVVGTAVLIGWRVVRGDDSLLRQVSFQHTEIRPNADGDIDITLIEYTLSRNASVSIYFENDAGQRFYFRNDRLRGAGDYRVYFGGIVDGYRLPDEQIDGEILYRVLQNGTYAWTITAADDEGHTEQAQGQLVIANADTLLPEIRDFSLDKAAFTPNRDGIDDRLLIQLYLVKEVENLRVFVQMPDGQELPISEQERDIPANMPGRHTFDYEGGVDRGATPPPDGSYPIIAVVQDRIGQQVRVADQVTIQFGGVPRGLIFPPPTGRTVEFNTRAVPLCHTLLFTLTVENYGNTPIRTTGPAPDTIYDSDWNYNTLGWHTESGAFRVGIGFENELTNYPYRWAVGGPDDLEEIDGHYYLMPGRRALVTGGIRIVGPLGERNPQPMWAGLIHEDVQVVNTRVDVQDILIDLPADLDAQSCED
jgi:hypothetical protein